MAKITHEEDGLAGNCIAVYADNSDQEIDIGILNKENHEVMVVRLNKEHVEQLIDTLLYWTEKQLTTKQRY